MAQYQILARKLLGPPGTGPKQNLGVKNQCLNTTSGSPDGGLTAAPAACTACGTLFENRIWSISGKFEIFEILVKSSNRFDDVSVVGMRCDADVNIAGLRDLSVKSVDRSRDVSSVCCRYLLIQSTTGNRTPSSVCTRRADEFDTNGISSLTDTASRGLTTIATPKSKFGLTHRIMVKRLATSPHDPLGITDSAYKNQSVMVSLQYGPFNTYISIRSTTIGKSRVARDPITMHTSWRSNSDIACVTRVSMTFRVVRTNQYNQDLGLIHSTNGNHLESPNEDASLKLGRPYPHFDGPID
ncbi:putative sucrose-phosphate synthase 1 [Dorcoceras hygrometricum]|uniref:Putative sucrose-phosphate synthase 1 n=1 Tax=Dorcoceras hygrometricum TaxID=472368 RepID=A0A2Z7C8N4_9LAMI|nr:putative sucrose-phosphate synthase 1 [Dorcoceras hygrometricum]